MLDWLRDDMQDPRIALGECSLPITIRRHARARRLTMRLAPDGSELRITMPRWCRTRDALVFAEARTAWIEAQLAALPAALAIEPGAQLPYRGKQLAIDWRKSAPRQPQLVDGAVVLGGPLASLERRLQRWLEVEALRLLGEDLAFYCTREGHAIPALKLSRARRRWGSCSGPRDGKPCIRINWRLVMAPDHVRRSVVAHEVAHLTHFDHSPAFHAALERIYDGNIAAADHWLRDEGRSLYAAFT